MTTKRARSSRLTNTPRILLLAALLGVWLGVSGCAKKRADAAPVAPPAPVPRIEPQLEPPPGPLSEPQTRAELPAPQAVPEGAAPLPKGPFAYEAPEVAELPSNPQPKPAPARPPGGSPAPAAEPVVEPVEPTPVPQLGPLISDQQRIAFQREIDRNFELTQAALTTLMGRRLSADQAEGVRRIREFLRQAQELRATDVALARNIADRARLFAEDLVRNTR
jgi:hypothetical protein